ncbi:Deoxycytidylate deaminase [Smittium culicis]|uniref:Deoxycytidylate deaminase n=1 Tax=Smittium culicis TaxID=133412 RepID=A0A1R1YCP3_9FUNG|nr:Deoxycytidylate deaminase [Smittium culicis]OMJ24681.1 Deoxycytidylate deaminase [Smittium culicis]
MLVIVTGTLNILNVFNRFISKNKDKDQPLLHDFIEISEKYTPLIKANSWSNQADGNQQPRSRSTVSVPQVAKMADIVVYNDFVDEKSLYNHLETLEITSTERIRPSWDTYFMKIAEIASSRSNCMKRKVGCVLVQNNQILATGYNGTPYSLLNCNEGGCSRCNSSSTSSAGTNLDLCLCLHAEENAIIQAGSKLIGAKPSTLYCNTCPCLGCAKKIVQSGIQRVVYDKHYSVDSHTATLFNAANIEFMKFENLNL